MGLGPGPRSGMLSRQPPPMTEGKSFAALLASYVLQGSIAPVLVSRIEICRARVQHGFEPPEEFELIVKRQVNLDES